MLKRGREERAGNSYTRGRGKKKKGSRFGSARLPHRERVHLFAVSMGFDLKSVPTKPTSRISYLAKGSRRRFLRLAACASRNAFTRSCLRVNLVKGFPWIKGKRTHTRAHTHDRVCIKHIIRTCIHIGVQRVYA